MTTPSAGAAGGLPVAQGGAPAVGIGPNASGLPTLSLRKSPPNRASAFAAALKQVQRPCRHEPLISPAPLKMPGGGPHEDRQRLQPALGSGPACRLRRGCSHNEPGYQICARRLTRPGAEALLMLARQACGNDSTIFCRQPAICNSTCSKPGSPVKPAGVHPPGFADGCPQLQQHCVAA